MVSRYSGQIVEGSTDGDELELRAVKMAESLVPIRHVVIWRILCCGTERRTQKRVTPSEVALSGGSACRTVRGRPASWSNAEAG